MLEATREQDLEHSEGRLFPHATVPSCICQDLGCWDLIKGILRGHNTSSPCPNMRPSIKPELILMTSYKPQAKIMKTLTPLTRGATSGSSHDRAPLSTQLSWWFPVLRRAVSLSPAEIGKGRISSVALVQASSRRFCLLNQLFYKFF